MAELVNNALMRELIDREVAKDMSRERQQRLLQPSSESAPQTPTTLNPLQALLLGSLADSASTYAFLKQGRREENPALQYFNARPWSVIPTAAAGAVGYKALYELMRRKSPRTADTLAGLLGGYHTALAAANTENFQQSHRGTGGSYGRTVDRLFIKANNE
jgi:hypothetical protein